MCRGFACHRWNTILSCRHSLSSDGITHLGNTMHALASLAAYTVCTAILMDCSGSTEIKACSRPPYGRHRRSWGCDPHPTWPLSLGLQVCQQRCDSAAISTKYVRRDRASPSWIATAHTFGTPSRQSGRAPHRRPLRMHVTCGVATRRTASEAVIVLAMSIVHLQNVEIINSQARFSGTLQHL